MNDQQAEAYGSDRQERINALKVRLTRLEAVDERLRKLNHALGNIAVAERPQQLKLIRSARTYIEAKIKPEPVQGIATSLRVLDNELQSLYEGIKSSTVTMSDLVLLSGVQAVKQISELKAVAEKNLAALEAQVEVHANATMHEITKAREAMAKIPRFEDREFIVWKCPVSFAGTNSSDSKFSKVGYLSVEKLDSLGFDASTIGGYTVLNRQLCIGINPRVMYREVEQKDEQGETVFEEDGTTPKTVMKRRTVKETVQKNKAGKPIKVEQRRDRTAHDEALEVLKLMEQKTGNSYTLISQKPASFNDGLWFWCMAAVDVRRLSKAFPGGRVDVQKWGFAGEQTSTEAPAPKPKHLTPRDDPNYKAI